MDQLLAWIRTINPFSAIPTINVVDAGPTVVRGYMPGTDLQAAVTVPQGRDGVQTVLAVIDDPQALDVTPEDLVTIVPGSHEEVLNHPAVIYPGPGDLIGYVARTGPDIQSGAVSWQELPTVIRGVQSAVIFVPEDLARV